MNKPGDEFDQLFDQAFEEAAQAHTTAPPDVGRSWSRVEKRLRRRYRRQRSIARLPLIAVSFILIVVLIGSPIVSAEHSPFFQKIKSAHHNVVSFIFGSAAKPGTAKTPPPPDEEPYVELVINETLVYEDVSYASWEEAAPHTVFENVRIGYVAPGYKHDETQLMSFETGGIATQALVTYVNDQDQLYRVSIRRLAAQEVLTSAIFGEREKVETVSIHDSEGYLALMKDGRAGLEYMYGRLHVSIIGFLDRDEILAIANDIQ